MIFSEDFFGVLNLFLIQVAIILYAVSSRVMPLQFSDLYHSLFLNIGYIVASFLLSEFYASSRTFFINSHSFPCISSSTCLYNLVVILWPPGHL